jgi:SAM-dependent methyltransferase
MRPNLATPSPQKRIYNAGTVARKIRSAQLRARYLLGTEIPDAEIGTLQGYRFLADAAAKFHGFVYLFGWFHHLADELADMFVIDADGASYAVEIGIPHGGVAGLGPNLGFRMQIFRHSETIDEDLHVVFVTRLGRWKRVRVADLCQARMAQYRYFDFERRFIAHTKTLPDARILDVGGRDRSGVDRSLSFEPNAVTVLDVLPSENVDVVGDAHNMAKLLPHGAFDAIYSVSVFEHLLMPWAVALQMNHVLKTGGVAFIATHQTIGMHDAPWDFWRFSDTAWDGIFNKFTGFEIVERMLDCEQFVIPFVWSPGKQDAERAAGFEVSAVWVKKTHAPTVSWDVIVADIAATSYPT